jgi:hypothetical protein
MKYEIDGKEIEIYFMHGRCMDKNGNMSSYGGETIAFTLNDFGDVEHTATARCLDTDLFRKKLGRIISAGRLLKKLGLPTKFAYNM